ncbi:hypothetical protein C1645_837966 [Glomus cerebriforme]|uniref:Coiled-coil domain-containing protein n=1 Tax=Glomus cerebriforme TaxID=658196 RepID=A0A397S956_9GLOM|nr:hypothetical protein C1645_837966 [Glomus cerebriforme]
MSNKRKRKRGLETEQPKYDAPPTSDKTSDTPRNFKRLLQANRFKKKKDVEIKDKSQMIQRMPGESFLDFNRRLEDHMRPDILKAMKGGKSTKDKAKRYREKLKEKKKAKIEKLMEEVNAKDFDDFQDKIKFGEVVQGPPSLTSLPKKRDKINTLKRDSLEKQKKNQLSIANKRIIAEERERVMSQYRLIKARKLLNKNPHLKD